MFWTRDLPGEVLGDGETFRLLCSLAAAALAREGRETCRIAALVPDGLRDLAPAMARHGARQERDARLLGALPAARGLEAVEVPPEADHARLLERRGSCPVHVRTYRGGPVSERDVLAHLAHGYVTAARAAARLECAAARLTGWPQAAGAALEAAAAARDRLAHCREGLLRFARAGHGAAVRLVVRENTLAEAAVHRDVSLAVLARAGRLLGWSMARSVVLEARVQAAYAYERVAGRHRAAPFLPPLPPGPGPVPAARPAAPPEPGGSGAPAGAGAPQAPDVPQAPGAPGGPPGEAAGTATASRGA